jgi:hypothetical protein
MDRAGRSDGRRADSTRNCEARNRLGLFLQLRNQSQNTMIHEMLMPAWAASDKFSRLTVNLLLAAGILAAWSGNSTAGKDQATADQAAALPGRSPQKIAWVLDAQSVSCPADGATTDFQVSFPHVRQRWIRPFLQPAGGEPKELGPNAYAWVNDNTIRLATAPAKGETVILRGSNGVRMPRDTNILHAFFVTGQSLAAESNKDKKQAAIATRPIYPGHALMPEGGVRPKGRYANFADLVETGEAGTIGLKETGASGLANHFIRDIEQLFGFKPQVFCAVVALGAQSLAEIGPGSKTSNELLQAVEDCIQTARKRGWRVIVSAIPFCQGETD